MRNVRRSYPFILVISILALTSLLVPFGQSSAATQRTLAWSVVDTPSDGVNGMVIRTCGINDLALGPDNQTFYIADTANQRFYKSTDAGYTWMSDIEARLTAASAILPVWNVAIAPDNVNFVLAVTDGSGAPSGPKQLFYSNDGGANWANTGLGLLLNANEYISCLDISKYDSSDRLRDIAVGTRITVGTPARILTRPYGASFSGAWISQGDPTWTAVTSVKFSPNYNPDQTLVVISFTAAGAALHLGQHDTRLNSTQWDNAAGYTSYPVNLVSLGAPYTAANIVRTGIELPSDYTGTDLNLRGCFVNIFVQANSVVLYVNNDALTYTITPPIQIASGQRISSILYNGTNVTGTLFAGSATTVAGQALTTIYHVADPQTYCTSPNPPQLPWLLSDRYKSPSGGANSGRSNALLARNANGITIYCGTSSEDSTAGGTGWGAGQWPNSKLTVANLDESAFSYCLDEGTTWNQIGLINTEISQLSDVAAVERPEDTTELNTLYLASVNDNGTVPYAFDSVWRSTSDPLGSRWERILTWGSAGNDTILRVNQTLLTTKSEVIVFADRFTDNIIYSSNEGQNWSQILAGVQVKDISLLDDTNMYILNDYGVRKATGSGPGWTLGKIINTDMLVPGHTICNPPTGSIDEELVFVGSEGNTDTSVAWADFSDVAPQFTLLKELPMQGNVHVVADDLYESEKNIYVGINDTITNADGIIYRWTMESSTNWDLLDPVDRGFYGLCMLNSVLYGAWNTDIVPPLNSSGADRTLEARVKVPPPPEWDQLTDGLPQPGSPNQVEFTREPTSLHISSNAYNTLWAIDNQAYDFNLKKGCLWQFVDSVAKLGPWPTAPAPGSLIGADPVTGRSQQIDFKWRPLRDIFGYDVLIAKDVNFTLPLSQQLQMTPLDDITGAWIVTPADQTDPTCWISPGVLEVGRSYYWKVRGSRSWQGTPIHSPWSPAMFFSVRPGFMVTAENMGPTLLTPVDGICSNCLPPIRFSWSPIKNAETYEFTLARDAQLKDVIVQETTQTTAFELKSRLSFSTPYYWQVKAVAPVISDPSPIGTFTLTENITLPQKQPAAEAKPGAVPAPSNFWIWIIIVIVVVLLLLINAYVVISRRRDQ